MNDRPENFIDDYNRIVRIHEQVKDLEGSNLPTMTQKLAVFLIEAQWVEFQLKNLVTSMIIHFGNPNAPFKRSAPKKIDKMTLGQINELLKEFSWDSPKSLTMQYVLLKKSVEKFINVRNKFTHHLFSNSMSEAQLLDELNEAIAQERVTSELLKPFFVHLYKELYGEISNR